MSDHRLDGRVAIVTGGGAGIGLAIGTLLAGAGARLVVGDVDAAAGAGAAGAIRAAGGEAVSVPCDVSDETGSRRLVREASSAFGRLDILVNNAGIYRRADVAGMSVEDWDRVLEVNLRGPFLAARAAIPLLRAQGGGAIVNIASRAGNKGEAGASAYAASKAGLIGFTRSLAAELAGSGIRVNAVCPGMVRTSMGADAPVIAGERWIAPDEVARLVLFLCADESSSVNGAVVDAYG